MEYRYDLWSMYSGRERLILHSESDDAGKHLRWTYHDSPLLVKLKHVT